MKKILLIVLLAAAAGLGGYQLIKDRRQPAPTVSNQQPPAAIKTKPPSTVTGSYLISGDVFWGRGIDYFAQRSPLKYDWPFSRLSEFHPENYNGWITDMECPVNDRTVPYQTQVDKLVLQCPTAYAPSAAKWFTAMTLANNHTDNTGRQGFIETQQNLTKAGIQVFGDYDLSQTDDLCEVVAMPAKVNGQPARLPIAMCGYHWLAREPTAAETAVITEYAKYFPVWVFAHGGTEYNTGYTPQQQALYHEFIDAGADVVFGDHPHVIEPTEAYKGKLIVYDLGNLIYDAWFDSEVTKSLIVNPQVSAAVDDNLQKYLDMGSKCKAFKDDCLQLAKSEGLHSYRLTYGYKIIGGERSDASLSDRLTHPDDATTMQWLLKRTDWLKTSKGLSRT